MKYILFTTIACMHVYVLHNDQSQQLIWLYNNATMHHPWYQFCNLDGINKQQFFLDNCCKKNWVSLQDRLHSKMPSALQLNEQRVTTIIHPYVRSSCFAFSSQHNPTRVGSLGSSHAFCLWHSALSLIQATFLAVMCSAGLQPTTTSTPAAQADANHSVLLPLTTAMSD